MTTNSAIIDRNSLVDKLAVELRLETPESRALSVRVGVDRELAKLFGARYFRGRDWNLLRPTYSLDEISKVLSSAGIEVSAEDLVREELKVDMVHNHYYNFVKVLDPTDNELYRLDYHRWCSGDGGGVLG